MSERAFQADVLQLAQLHHWRAAHFHDSRRQIRPGVHVGDKLAAGVPDLLLAKPGHRAFFAELKAATGKPSPAQVEWLDALSSAGVECYLWYPGDLVEIQKLLGRRWRFHARGERSTLLGRQIDTPCLSEHEGERLWTPGSLWLSGQGRADAVAVAA